MTGNALNLIGIACKAGKLELGEEPTGAACRAHHAKLVLLASDAAENSARRAESFAGAGKVPCLASPFTKAELGWKVGRSSCAMLAFTDAGLAAALCQKLAELDPERFGETAEVLAGKAAKVQQRQKEKRIHEKRLRAGREHPWAAPPRTEPKKP